MKQKVSVLMLVLALMVALFAACSSNTNEKADEQTNTGNRQDGIGETNDQPLENAAAVDPFGRYEEPVEITFAGYIDDTMQKNLLVGGLSYEQNQWTEIIEK